MKFSDPENPVLVPNVHGYDAVRLDVEEDIVTISLLGYEGGALVNLSDLQAAVDELAS